MGFTAYADVGGLGGVLTLYWENGVPKIYLGTISAGSGSLVVDEPVIAFRERDGSGSSWYGSHRAYINDGTEQGFVVHGHTSGHGITVDFPVSGRIDFFVDTTYVGYVTLASSDEKTKRNIHSIEEAYKNAVKNVELKNFHFGFDKEVLSGANSLLRFGAIAQDVIAALKAQGIDPGDKIKIDGRKYTVSGMFLRPDYLYVLENLTDDYKNISTFFLTYMTKDGGIELTVQRSDVNG